MIGFAHVDEWADIDRGSAENKASYKIEEELRMAAVPEREG